MVRSLLAWASLMRLANGFTALSNILAAYFVICLWLDHWFAFPVYLLAATLCFYFAGMILNDVFDIEEDRLLRPERILPRGIITVRAARLMGFYLILCGLIFSYFQSSMALIPGTILALCILIYDSVLKQGLPGSVLMGLCRFLNWLLGLSFAFGELDTSRGIAQTIEMILRHPLLEILPLIALPIFFYVTSLTYLSKQETRAEDNRPIRVAAVGLLAAFVCVPGLIYLGVFSWWGLLVFLPGLGYLIFRLIRLYRSFEPSAVRSLIKLLVLGIIPLDALMVLSAARDPWSGAMAAASVLLLLWPARVLSGRFQVT